MNLSKILENRASIDGVFDLQNLPIDEVIEFYDIPMLYLTHDLQGNLYVALVIDMENEIETVLLIKEPECCTLQELKDKHSPLTKLLPLVEYIKINKLYILYEYMISGTRKVYDITFEELSEDYLPDKSCYLF